MGDRTSWVSLGLRLWFGVPMILYHGLPKLLRFSEYSKRFPDVLHLGNPAYDLALTIGAEVFCAILVTTGLLTRLAAAVLAFNVGMAFVAAHDMRMRGENNGEIAFLYLGAFLALIVLGSGRFSVDRLLGRK